MHLAVQAERGSSHSVNKLLALGADPTQVNKAGKTPIQMLGPKESADNPIIQALSTPDILRASLEKRILAHKKVRTHEAAMGATIVGGLCGIIGTIGYLMESEQAAQFSSDASIELLHNLPYRHCCIG